MKRFIRALVPPKYRYRLAHMWRDMIGYDRYSQFGEDQILLEIFGEKRDGFYVDVGAHHPQRYSNTYLLHARGWKGINIDPDPHTIELFKAARPHDRNILTGIGVREEELDYYRFSDSAVNTFVKEEAERWMGKDWLTFEGVRKVPVRPLRAVLSEHAPGKKIDLINIDVEGMGLEVLESLDWGEHRPHVIVVEGEVREYLEGKGYLLYKDVELSHIFVESSHSNA